jgi:hypothetical protein
VYTDTSDTFWLFYHPGTADEIENLRAEDQVTGYWLDKTQRELHYKLLVESRKASIVALNLISEDQDELGLPRFRKHLDIKNDVATIISVDFDYSVKECLKKHGFE